MAQRLVVNRQPRGGVHPPPNNNRIRATTTQTCGPLRIPKNRRTSTSEKPFNTDHDVDEATGDPKLKPKRFKKDEAEATIKLEKSGTKSSVLVPSMTTVGGTVHHTTPFVTNPKDI